MKLLMLAKIVGLGLLGIVLVFIIVRAVYNWRASRRPESAEFAGGHLPKDLPDGFYRGGATVSKGNWQGKKFDAASATGINVFTSGDRYRFHMYDGQGLTNRGLSVLKIDYNQAGNPWWLRLVVDEVVEVGPNQLLGKIQIKAVPYLPLTIGYFSLGK